MKVLINSEVCFGNQKYQYSMDVTINMDLDNYDCILIDLSEKNSENRK